MADQTPEVLTYVRSGRSPLGACDHARVSFLAAGEYNANYLIRTPDRTRVLRVNHGSQLGLAPGAQIAYEYAVLQAVAPSGVTPRPLGLDAAAPLGHGILIMEYLPGRPLDYASDALKAAQTLARIHALPVPDGLVRQPDPVAAIAAESLGLLQRYPDHPLSEVRDRLLAYHAAILDLGRDLGGLLTSGPQVLVNTEVNSGNFLVQDGQVRLVDWEKAVVSCPWQDIGHFLVPTTTLWKTDFRFTPETRLEFLAAYARAAGLSAPLEEISRTAGLMERVILLRALSWCYMAHYEYTRPGRPLTCAATFAKIESYLDGLECFLS